jgi:hypothetical protein
MIFNFISPAYRKVLAGMMIKASLGILGLTRDPKRGPVLRQTTLTEGSFRTAEGTFLEVISGP